MDYVNSERKGRKSLTSKLLSTLYWLHVIGVKKPLQVIHALIVDLVAVENILEKRVQQVAVYHQKNESYEMS